MSSPPTLRPAEEHLTREQASALYDSGWWRDKSPEEVVKFQLFKNELCLPLPLFECALEIVLGRSVSIIDNDSVSNMKKEFLEKIQITECGKTSALRPAEEPCAAIIARDQRRKTVTFARKDFRAFLMWARIGGDITHNDYGREVYSLEPAISLQPEGGRPFVLEEVAP